MRLRDELRAFHTSLAVRSAYDAQAWTLLAQGTKLTEAHRRRSRLRLPTAIDLGVTQAQRSAKHRVYTYRVVTVRRMGCVKWVICASR